MQTKTGEALNELIKVHSFARVWLPQAETKNEFLTRAKNEGYQFGLGIISITYVDHLLWACKKESLFDCMTALGELGHYAKLYSIDDAIIRYK